MSQAHITLDDPRLTAYVLGELEPVDVAAIEAALAESPQLRQVVEELRDTSAELFAALQAEPAPTGEVELAGQVAGRKVAVPVEVKQPPTRRGGLLLVNAVTLLLLIGVVISLRGGGEQRARHDLAQLSPQEVARLEQAQARERTLTAWEVESRATLGPGETLADELDRATADWERARGVIHDSEDLSADGTASGTAPQLQQLVTDYNSMMEQKRFAEAHHFARQARELAPKDPAAAAMFYQSQFAARAAASERLEGEKEAQFWKPLTEVEQSAVANGASPVDAAPDGSRSMLFGDNWEAFVQRRHALGVAGSDPASDQKTPAVAGESSAALRQQQLRFRAEQEQMVQERIAERSKELGEQQDRLQIAFDETRSLGTRRIAVQPGSKAEEELLRQFLAEQLGGESPQPGGNVRGYLLRSSSDGQPSNQPGGNQPGDSGATTTFEVLGVAGRPNLASPGTQPQSQLGRQSAGQPEGGQQIGQLQGARGGAVNSLRTDLYIIDPSGQSPQGGQPGGTAGQMSGYNNYGAVTYPQQYDRSAWPQMTVWGVPPVVPRYDQNGNPVLDGQTNVGAIGFYPQPQVPAEWRKAQLNWDDGHWNFAFRMQDKERLLRESKLRPEQLAQLQKLSESEGRVRGWYEGAPWPAYAPYLGSEAYAPVEENDFTVPQGEDALSTFSLDVDTASYSNVRRFITQQQLPPPDAVRLEELVNYFDYDLPRPEGEDPFSVTLEATSCPWNPRHRLVRIGLQGREMEMDKRPLTRLVFLLDVSGSMSSANKLPLVKESMKLLVDQLGENDRIAIVTYSGAAELKLDSTAGTDKETILTAIDNLSAGGSTNGAGGIQLAYETAAKQFLKEASNRVILCTDGDFNVGVSSDDELVKMIETKRESGVFLSIFGFGMGNLKDSKLEGLANKGNGHYGYIDDLDEARKVFIEELTGLLYTIAKDVKLQVEFNPAKVAAYRLLGYENRKLAAEDFNNDKVDAGEMGAGHTVTALYEIVPTTPFDPPSAVTPDAAPAVDPLKYQPSTVRDQPLERGDQQSETSQKSNEEDRETTETLAAGSKSDAETLTNQESVQAIAKVLKTIGLKGYEVEVRVHDGRATITGRVANDSQRKAIDGVAKRFPNLIWDNLVVAAATTRKHMETRSTPPELLTVKLRYKQPDGDDSTKLEFPLNDEPQRCSQDLQFAAAVTGFGMLLRHSQHAAGCNWDLVMELAEGAKGEDEHGRRAEFVDLARKARRLWQAAYPQGSPAEWRARMVSYVTSQAAAQDEASTGPSASAVTGAVILVDESNRMIWIDRGRNNGVYQRMTFDVVATGGQDNTSDSPHNARLEVVQVQADAAQCRVLEQDLQNPIRVKDKVIGNQPARREK